MFGGHIPEEPAPPRGRRWRFRRETQPRKNARSSEGWHRNGSAITRAAGRVLYEIVQFGYLDGQSKHDVTTQSIEANAKIIEKTGEDAAVLLKNEGGVLPLEGAANWTQWS